MCVPIPQLGRSPEKGNGYPLQYSCIENFMGRRAWWATVHGVTKNQTQISDYHFSSISRQFTFNLYVSLKLKLAQTHNIIGLLYNFPISDSLSCMIISYIILIILLFSHSCTGAVFCPQCSWCLMYNSMANGIQIPDKGPEFEFVLTNFTCLLCSRAALCFYNSLFPQNLTLQKSLSIIQEKNYEGNSSIQTSN